MKFFKDVVDASTWLAALKCCVLEFTIVGSAVYREDPRDVDFLVLVKPDVGVQEFCRRVSDDRGKISLDPLPYGKGWAYCGDQYENSVKDGWMTMRKGNVNLIVTEDKEWYDDCYTASEVCAALGLERKSDRVRVHRVIRDRMPWEQAKTAPMREGVVD